MEKILTKEYLVAIKYCMVNTRLIIKGQQWKLVESNLVDIKTNVGQTQVIIHF